jgi:colicin import membrane protein
MKFAQPVPAPGRRAAVALALAVHLLLVAFLFYGIRWQSRPAETVEVELVRAAPEPPQAEAPPPKMEVLPEVKPEPKPEPKVEAKAPPKPEIAVKEKPKLEPKPKPVKEAPVPPKPKFDPFQKQLDEEFKKTDERKTAASAAQELDQLKAAKAASARDRAKGDYEAKIRGKVRGNIVLPPGIKGNPEAIFDVVQLPGGEILSVKLKKASGHEGYDKAVERAILKSSPLPKPEQADLFSRSLELKFRPLDD